MKRVVLVVLLLAALGGTAFLLLRSGSEGGGLGGGFTREDGTAEEQDLLYGPGLQGTPGGGRPRPPAPPPPAPQVPEVVKGETLLTVRVVDEATGRPIPNPQVWFEPGGKPCPRLPGEEYLVPPPGPESSQVPIVFAGDADGVLLLTSDQFARPSSANLDVFATASGHVMGVGCAVPIPGEVTIRLARGLTLRGTVTDLQGKPLDGAAVLARPGATTPPVPGHAGWAVTDAQGRFEMDGLLAGSLTVTVRHEGHFPLAVLGEEPSDDRARSYALAPEYVLRFRLRSDDGRDLVNPTLRLATSAQPPYEAITLLRLTDDKGVQGVLTEGVALPANAPHVALEVKADGYAPWRRLTEPIPPEGGEHTYEITLLKSAGTGSLKVVLEDDRGQHVGYSGLNPLPPTIQPLDRQDLGGGVVLEAGPDLRFPSLPVGRYRIGVRAFAFAPVLVEGNVLAGTEAEARATLRPAARVRVKFTAPTARIVRFRVLQDGQVVPAMPEHPAAPDPAAAGGDEEPVLSAGEAGVLLGGLGSGTYVIEVLSDDLQPSRTSVRPREGDIEEVEIRVQPR